ncbi:hypothetical protein SAMN05421858_0882 [Haladaptatus litoreus]|uniref:AMP-binding enzyme n=1 Tax=Haladaptatus litoreus TaxID=553468 RepID=A0A1N6WVA3_9EURY|nr:hypothetical protein [Haladaptatus litoreus]SIQ94013.1 hypothetical protein SAMN05421858_0882 [Haladaptatus litoreus]
MDALSDLVARERRSDDPVLSVPDSRGYDYHRLCTTAWKTGNFFRHLGVRDGVTVGIVPSSSAQSILGFLGATLLGASVRFDPPRDIDARVLLAPTETVGDYELPPGGQYVGHGEKPADPTVSHFETDVWSENPTFPETALSPETIALTGERDVSHAELLATGSAVCDRWNLEPGDSVVVRAPLSDPRVVAGGIIAPLVGGAEIVLDADRTGDFAVCNDAEAAPESVSIAPDVITL